VYFTPQTIKPGFELVGNEMAKRCWTTEIQNILKISLWWYL